MMDSASKVTGAEDGFS